VTTPISSPAVDVMAAAIRLVVPEVALVGAACVLFLFAAFSVKRITAFVVTLLGIGLAMLLANGYGPQEAAIFGSDRSSLFFSTIDPLGSAMYFRWLTLIGAAVLAFLVYGETSDRTAGEYYGCFLVLMAGVSLVGRANDLITLYLALEMISIPTYVLLYLPSISSSAATGRSMPESAVKYFFLSILSSAILLFGFGYLYGAAGSTNLAAISEFLTQANRESFSPLAIIGIVLAIAGIGFRIAAVPFHFYAPDVYQAGPTGVVAILAVVPKWAGFAALIRLLGMADLDLASQPFDANSVIPFVLWVLAAVSMTFGNVLALLQDNLKRIMAYSGIAHAGYLLIGLSAAGSGRSGIDAMLFYLAAYGLMTAGFFAVVLAVHRSERPVETVDDLAGLAVDRPVAAACLGIALLSMIGIPLTAGFPGKLQLFLSAYLAPTDTPMGFGLRTLAFVAAVNAAIGAVYYLRILGAVYLRTPLVPFVKDVGRPALIAALACAIGTLAFGIYPKPLSEFSTPPALPAKAVVAQ
jgi:NADH-quinone oxidoreductase subunit N